MADPVGVAEEEMAGNIRSKGNGSAATFDPITGAPSRPDGAGMYLHWDGRRSYRTRMPVPRVLEPVEELGGATGSENRVIEGDNLQVMVSLRPHYRSVVDVAYLDPPYNTGKNDFPYSDRRFRDPNADSDDAVYVSNEDGGRHTKWLNYMAPRLHLVHELLADSGICFVSINDVELFRLGMLMDEIFGEANRLGVIIWKNATDNNPTRIATGHEYILCYAKRVDEVPTVWAGQSEAKLWMLRTFDELHARLADDVPELERQFQAAVRSHVRAYKAARTAEETTDLIDLGALDRYVKVDARGPYAANRHTDNPNRSGYYYDIVHPVTGQVCKKPTRGYRFPPERMQQLMADDRIIFGKDHTQLVQLKKYLRDIREPLRSVIELDGRAGANTLRKLFPGEPEKFKNPKPVELMTQLIEFAGDSDALVLDPFAGSATTAHAVMRLNAKDAGNRRYIMIEEGNRDDRYCRTLTAARITAAAKFEKLDGGFDFLETGRRLNREAILELERKAISSLIAQTDITGTGRGIARLEGEYVIGHNARREAICLKWNGRADSTVTRDVLVAMFEEAKKLNLNRPLRVYGSTCVVAETDSFRFCQIPDEILAALHIGEEAAELPPEEAVRVVEALEGASQGLVGARAGS
jgi:adenine-specific DNA-methyltransferase